MKLHFKQAKLLVLPFIAAVAFAASCSVGEEEYEPVSESPSANKQEWVDFSAAIDDCTIETKTSGVDNTPSVYWIGVYDVQGNKVGVLTQSGNTLSLNKYGKYSFYAFGGSAASGFTSSNFPSTVSGITSMLFPYGWSVASPSSIASYITSSGGPVYGKAERVTPLSLLSTPSSTVIRVPVKRKIARYTLNLVFDNIISSKFTSLSANVRVNGVSIGFFPDGGTTNRTDLVAAEYNDVYGTSRPENGLNSTYFSNSSITKTAGLYRKSFELAIPENLQGNLLPTNNDPASKDRNALLKLDPVPEGVTYIELDINYASTVLGVSGTATYRFYPGRDNTSDFNIDGGKSSTITCNFSYNGLFADATWKQDTEGLDDDRKIRCEVQDHNYVKGDTLWYKMSYAYSGDYYTYGTYDYDYYAFAVNDPDTIDEFVDWSMDGAQGGLPSDPPGTKVRRTATCNTCGTKYFGVPLYNSNATYARTWCNTHFVQRSLSWYCPICGAFYAEYTTGDRDFLRQATDGSSSFGLTFGSASSQYYEVIPAVETKTTYQIYASTFDGQVSNVTNVPIGPLTYVTIQKNQNYQIHVAQKSTYSINVQGIASSSRSGMTFTATLAPQGGGAAQNVTSWLSSSYNAVSYTWTLTLSAKAAGTVTIKAFLPSSDQVGECNEIIVNPEFITFPLYLYPSGEETQVSYSTAFNTHYYFRENGGASRHMSVNNATAALAFDTDLYMELLQPTSISFGSSTCIGSERIQSYISGNYNPYYWTVWIKSFGGTTIRNLLVNNLTDISPTLTTYTLSTPNGLTATSSVEVWNLFAMQYDNGTIRTGSTVDGGVANITIDERYEGAIQSVAWRWDETYGAAYGSISTITKDGHDISLASSSSKNAGYDRIGVSFVYATLYNSVGGHSFEYPLERIVFYSPSYQLYIQNEQFDVVYQFDDGKYRYYVSGAVRNVKYNNSVYEIKAVISMKNSSYPSHLWADAEGTPVPWSNLITSYGTPNSSMGYCLDTSYTPNSYATYFGTAYKSPVQWNYGSVPSAGRTYIRDPYIQMNGVTYH